MKNNATATALEKRIKRRVTGREHLFFAVTLPGLERLCAKELAALGLDVQPPENDKGGVTFSGQVHELYAANLHLQTASRILMRIDQFQATGFPQMEKHLLGFPWELYLHRGQTCNLKVTSRQSRLIHTTAIAERFNNCIAQRLTGQPGLHSARDTRLPPQTLFVRGVHDRFIVSIDASGTPLYKRGLKTSVGKAPLRETFASAALSLAGYTPGNILVDPMCGSGTFALEAAMRSCCIPPGWFRDFAFLGWPCYRPGRWKHLRKTAAEKIHASQNPLIFASDLDPQAIDGLQRIVTKFDLGQVVAVACRDFFTLDPAVMAMPPGTITLNPPYGVRLKTGTPVETFYAATGRHLAAKFKGWRLALILPNDKLLNHLPFKVDALPFAHGGLKLILATGKIR